MLPDVQFSDIGSSSEGCRKQFLEVGLLQAAVSKVNTLQGGHSPGWGASGWGLQDGGIRMVA